MENIIKRLYKIASKIDKSGYPDLSDKLEKTAATMLNVYVPQSTLMRGYQEIGGGPTGGQLGGYHTQFQLTGGGQFNPQAIQEAGGLIGELGAELPQPDQWAQQHPNIKSDPRQVYNILKIWRPFYLSGVTNINQLQSVLSTSGPIDLQVATQAPGSYFQQWGITPQEIMEHEIGHAQKATSSPQEYLQLANPNIDIMENKGVGGNVNPVKGYYQNLLESFMAGQGAEEYGPSKKIWQRVVRERAPQ